MNSTANPGQRGDLKKPEQTGKSAAAKVSLDDNSKYREGYLRPPV